MKRSCRAIRLFAALLFMLTTLSAPSQEAGEPDQTSCKATRNEAELEQRRTGVIETGKKLIKILREKDTAGFVGFVGHYGYYNIADAEDGFALSPDDLLKDFEEHGVEYCNLFETKCIKGVTMYESGIHEISFHEAASNPEAKVREVDLNSDGCTAMVYFDWDLPVERRTDLPMGSAWLFYNENGEWRVGGFSELPVLKAKAADTPTH